MALPWPDPVLALSPSVRRDQYYTLTCKNALHLQEDGLRGGRRGFGGASIRHHCSRMSERGDRSGRPENVRAARGACRSAMHVWTSRFRGCTARTVPPPKDCGSWTPNARVLRGAGLPPLPGLETGVWIEMGGGVRTFSAKQIARERGKARGDYAVRVRSLAITWRTHASRVGRRVSLCAATCCRRSSWLPRRGASLWSYHQGRRPQ